MAHTIIVDTIEFFPHHCNMSFPSTKNAVTTMKELTHAIQNPAPSAPFSQMGDDTIAAIHQLAQVLTTSLEKFPPKQKPAPN